MAKTAPARAIGRRLAEAREERGLSQTALASALRMTRSAVNQWESGTTSPSTENLSEAAVYLEVSFDWLATGRGLKELVKATPPAPQTRIARVPLLDWVSAGRLTEPMSQIPVDQVPLLAFADLGRGDYFALRVSGNSMDRISPEGSVIVVNRADRELVADKPYVFTRRGEATFKLWQPEPPHLAPYSTDPANKPIFVKGKREFEVVGRVRRTVLDL